MGKGRFFEAAFFVLYPSDNFKILAKFSNKRIKFEVNLLSKYEREKIFRKILQIPGHRQRLRDD